VKKFILCLIAAACLVTSAYPSTPLAYSGAAAVTPNDTTNLPASPASAIWVGGTGNLTVDMYNGATITFSAVPAGTLLLIRVKRVRATLTTATLIVALY
jgi:hypothetical protein